MHAYHLIFAQTKSNSGVKVSEVNTLIYGKCIKIWGDEEFEHTDGQLGVHVGLQMLDTANHNVKAFFSGETTVFNLITGVHAGVNAYKVKPHTSGHFQLRCKE